ncbi:hypothetical protein [Speluncibacter jeojiensis]|uniref:Uncharacterized protein n=1 Tax=Speluncibacter jeojiensis TaxID=2710754 RepID=A0A9X4M1N1_9ACTN|nr:hypothetical protein [Corynebacteriales bacterium D3-21]
MNQTEPVVPASTGKSLRITLGAAAGAALAVLGYVPFVWWMQSVFDVPQPSVHPEGLPLSVDPPAVGYWVSWAVPGVAVLLCTLATIPSRPARQFALPLAIAFLALAGLLAWFFVSMDLFFTAD